MPLRPAGFAGMVSMKTEKLFFWAALFFGLVDLARVISFARGNYEPNWTDLFGWVMFWAAFALISYSRVNEAKEKSDAAE